MYIIAHLAYVVSPSIQALTDIVIIQFSNIFLLNLPARTDHRDAMLLTATVSNFTFERVDGVKGENVLDKALPPQTSPGKLSAGMIGSWRAHLNVLAE